MARIGGIDDVPDNYVARAFDQQRAKWGVHLEPYRIYARRPTIFRAVQGMWAGLSSSGLLPGDLIALVNRHVAALNGCVF